MRQTFGVAALAIFCSVYEPLAQGRPNFAGNWALTDPNTRSSGGIMFVGLAFTAEQDDRTLTVTPTLPSDPSRRET